jgi:Bacterial membrane protein YfhO
MGSRREIIAFCALLAACVGVFFHATLFGGKVLSPADVLLVSASFREPGAGDYEPGNRLLMDPVLQFQPWLEFNRTMIRNGRLPLWNGHAGCGVPHLANGQSAVFDPFHLLAYVGTTPQAYAWIAAGRLWMAGLGMFLLARSLGLGPWGRWFAGSAYPFCGFLVLWLLFPVTAVAIWMPWLFLATDRLFRLPGAKGAAWLAVVVALVVFGGHIQTSAHVLLAGGLYALAKGFWARATGAGWRRFLISWTLGTCLGLGLSAVQILPLGFYLAKSPVWSDRRTERPAWWVIDRPRLLDAMCTAAPYLYGSQRRGHPNLARALGVHNLNESAGGYAGLATLIWLAPLAVVVCGREPRVVFLTALVVVGAMGAFRWPPVDNLLRAVPVLNVTDNRRLTLWVAFGLTLLGGIGLDHLGQSHRLPRGWIVAWVVTGVVLGSFACAIPSFERQLRERAEAHYHQVALNAQSTDVDAYHARALRQVRQVIEYLAPYHALVAVELGGLAALAAYLSRLRRSPFWIKPALIGLTLFDLAGLGFDLNPAIPALTHALEPRVVARLRQVLPPDGRVLGLGEELPPNVLMRFGLSDVRNYDSVELASSLSWFKSLYEPISGSLSSRSEITWNGVIRARDRLIESGVGAIVASSPPPQGVFERVERVDRVWISWLAGKPWADSNSARARLAAFRDHGQARILVNAPAAHTLAVRETWVPGWKALIDGQIAKIQRKSTGFMNIEIPAGEHELILKYDPLEVRLGIALSFCSLVLVILVLTENRLFWIPGITTAKGLDGPEPSG